MKSAKEQLAARERIRRALCDEHALIPFDQHDNPLETTADQIAADVHQRRQADQARRRTVEQRTRPR